MKRTVVTAIGAVMMGIVCDGSAWAFDIEGLPGSTWGQASYEKADIAGPGVLGYVNQGVDWITLPGELTLNTFVEVRYRFRENNKAFYNAYGPAVGVELRRSPWHLGVDYYWERYPELSEASNRLQFYLSWFHDWDLKKR
jgi:hypothetical protein